MTDFETLLETMREHGIDPDKNPLAVKFASVALVDVMRHFGEVVKEAEAINMITGNQVSLARCLVIAHQTFIKVLMKDPQFQVMVNMVETAAKEFKRSQVGDNE
jgi:hypothetical protein